jgi:hypothetical protein
VVVIGSESCHCVKKEEEKKKDEDEEPMLRIYPARGHSNLSNLYMGSCRGTAVGLLEGNQCKIRASLLASSSRATS